MICNVLVASIKHTDCLHVEHQQTTTAGKYASMFVVLQLCDINNFAYRSNVFGRFPSSLPSLNDVYAGLPKPPTRPRAQCRSRAAPVRGPSALPPPSQTSPAPSPPSSTSSVMPPTTHRAHRLSQLMLLSPALRLSSTALMRNRDPLPSRTL